MAPDTFLGRPIDYWLEINQRINDGRFESVTAESLLTELIAANAKLRYYENHLDQMLTYRKACDKL